jgi:SsrA-binding protein
MSQTKVDIKNKKAYYEFEIVETFTAGIKLFGTEIKAIRDGGGSINEAFCQIRNEELWVRNMNIPEYSLGTYANHEPVRERKLLLKKKELDKIDSRIREKGMTVVPLRLFLSDRGFAKLEIGIGRGKKTFDKRETIKQKDSKREMDRVLKKYK